MSGSIFSKKDIDFESKRRMPICICIEDSEFIQNYVSDIKRQVEKLLNVITQGNETCLFVDIYISLFSDKVREVTNGFIKASDLVEGMFNLNFHNTTSNVCLVSCLNEAYNSLLVQKNMYESKKKTMFTPVFMLIGSGNSAENIRTLNESLYTHLHNNTIALVPIVMCNRRDENMENYRYLVNDSDEIWTAHSDLSDFFNSFFESINTLSQSTAGKYKKVMMNDETKWRTLK